MAAIDRIRPDPPAASEETTLIAELSIVPFTAVGRSSQPVTPVSGVVRPAAPQKRSSRQRSFRLFDPRPGDAGDIYTAAGDLQFGRRALTGLIIDLYV